MFQVNLKVTLPENVLLIFSEDIICLSMDFLFSYSVTLQNFIRIFCINVDCIYNALFLKLSY